MAATVEDKDLKGGGGSGVIDQLYEFSAPKFFDFGVEESEEEMRMAELWFESALSYAPSPCMPKIKEGRDVKVEAVCDFEEAHQQVQIPEECKKETSETNSVSTDKTALSEQNSSIPNTVSEVPIPIENVQCYKSKSEGVNESKASSTCIPTASPKGVPVKDAETLIHACTPKSQMISKQVCNKTVSVKNVQSSKNVTGVIHNPSALRTKSQCHSTALTKSKKLGSTKRDVEKKHAIAMSNLVQENQAIKRQKLDEGNSRQILNVKPVNLPHKSRPGVIPNTCGSQSTTSNLRKEDRKMYVREPAAAPFVSMAEMVLKFQSKTREIPIPHDATSGVARTPKLTLTRPKEPEFITSQRARPVKIKSTAELEEEMMAKIPKFKARPVNRKILEASTLPPLPRSTVHTPEFQEFHLHTMARANQNADTCSVTSTESSRQTSQWKPRLTEPKTPQLQTSLRARPPTVKSSSELELEELQKVPKFKAKPLNKKIFESKGELGIFCTMKKPVTIPQEFHFATDERIPSANAVVNMFDKLSICSESRHDTQAPRLTRPNPFHLRTEERGAEKEMRFVTEVMRKQLEEEKARVPKAYPYPYTTDFPVVPPKPEPKKCTTPEPFQLESLVRHEDELRREMEERQRLEKEAAEMRIFKAQPILKDSDPIPLPEKVRIPLTRVEEFNLQADHRAVERAEFDKKVHEKEMLYKRYREEGDAAKMMEDEKALKQMRRTMVPHARPVPKFDNPFCPQRSLQHPTMPKSPKLRVLQRMRTARQTLGSGLSSSAAANMR